jgi:predicted DCC family thiol-disulfide oxidoreductase YuxK
MVRVFLFDGDCAFCTSSANLLKRLTANRIPIEPYQFADLEKLGVSKAACEQAVQYLNPKHFDAARAIAQVLIDARTPWAIAGWVMRAPVILSFAELVYVWVSKNRHKFPGGTPACELKAKN